MLHFTSQLIFAYNGMLCRGLAWYNRLLAAAVLTVISHHAHEFAHHCRKWKREHLIPIYFRCGYRQFGWGDRPQHVSKFSGAIATAPRSFLKTCHCFFVCVVVISLGRAIADLIRMYGISSQPSKTGLAQLEGVTY